MPSWSEAVGALRSSPAPDLGGARGPGGLGLLYVGVRGLDLGALAAALAQVDGGWLAAAAALWASRCSSEVWPGKWV